MDLKAAVSAARLYGILDLSYVFPAEARAMASRLIDGGVQILQLRAKRQPDDLIASCAEKLTSVCEAAGVPFILNDHPHLVGVTGAHGVHIGQDDLSVSEARRLAGPGALVGKSSHSVNQAVATAAEDVDYLGFGPLFATPTKPDYTPIGTQDIAEVYRRISRPVFCIGGIKRENLATVLDAGAERVVIVSGLLQAADVAAYARACRRLLDAKS